MTQANIQRTGGQLVVDQLVIHGTQQIFTVPLCAAGAQALHIALGHEL